MATKSISQLDTQATANETDLFEVAIVDANSASGYASKKESAAAIADAIVGEYQYPLRITGTTAKTIAGAINELKNLVDLLPQFAIEVVQTLPVSDISTTTIYLVPAQDPEQGNYYEEYIYVNNAWELVGTTAVDLSGYYTSAQVDTLLAAKANTSSLATVATSGAYSDLSGKPTIDTALDDTSTNAVENRAVASEINSIKSDITVEGSASGDIATFVDGSANPLKELKISIVATQSGSGDPSPTNVRPITGWTGAKIVDDSVYGGFINWNQLILDAEAHKSGTPTTSYWITTNTFSLIVNHKYILVRSGTYSAEQNAARVVSTISPTIIYDSCIPKSGQYQSSIFNCTETRNSYFVQARVIENEPFDFYLNLFDLTQMFGSTIADYIYSLEQATTGAGVAYFRNLFPHDYYNYNSGEITNVSAVNGETDKYNTVDINWQSTAGTVYGGTLDVLTGVLIVTHAFTRLDALTWTKYTNDDTSHTFQADVPSGIKPIASNSETANIKCTCYKTRNFGSVDSWKNSNNIICQVLIGKIFIRDERYSDAQTFSANLGDNGFVYKYETPVTYQLTPTEIRSLLGTNNVFADCGAITELKYTRDLNLCINDIIARIEALEGGSNSRSLSVSPTLTKSLTSELDTTEGILEGKTEETEEETKEEAQNER